MRNVKWWAQNEVVDDDGLFPEDDKVFMQNELAYLREQGCPDTEQAANLEMEVHDRDSATIEADVSDAMAAWLEAEELLWEE